MVFAENEYRRLARFRSHGHPVSLVLADLSRRLFIRLTAVEIERPLNESRPPRVPRFAVRKFPRAHCRQNLRAGQTLRLTGEPGARQRVTIFKDGGVL